MPETNKRGPQNRIPRQPDFMRAPKPDHSALGDLLNEWMRGDATEQRETFEALRRSLDEDRPDGYKLFS
jgi:hypothetical protein